MYELERKTPEIKRGRSKSVGKNLRLGERDFFVLRFILEMKFCSAEQIWERFFRYAGGTDGTIKYTQNRLSRLRRGEYLNSHYTYDGPVRYYTATAKAFDLVLNHFDLREKDMPEPSKVPDMRSFTHDKGLVWLRIFWENMGLIDALSWDSESCIKRRTLYGLKPEATREAIQDETWPDAFVRFKTTENGDSYALEFEHTVKGPSRRLEKIDGHWWTGSSVDVSKCKLFIYSNSQVERAYAESFKKYFWDAANGKDGKGEHLPYLEKSFFDQLFMVANYAAIRESYEKFLSGSTKTVEQHQQCYSMEPSFFEVCEHIEKRLQEEQKEQDRKEKENKRRRREDEIIEQHKREVKEWKNKWIGARVLSKPPKKIRLEDLAQLK